METLTKTMKSFKEFKVSFDRDNLISRDKFKKMKFDDFMKIFVKTTDGKYALYDISESKKVLSWLAKKLKKTIYIVMENKKCTDDLWWSIGGHNLFEDFYLDYDDVYSANYKRFNEASGFILTKAEYKKFIKKAKDIDYWEDKPLIITEIKG